MGADTADSSPARDASAAPPADAAARAFEVGNFGEARRLARAMLTAAPDEAARSAARTLLDRLSVDPVAVAMMVGCLVLFVSLLFWSYR